MTTDTVPDIPVDTSDFEEVGHRQLPLFEGHSIEKVVVAFGGSFELNPSLDADAEILDRLRLNQEVAITVYGKVTGVAFNARSDTDGNDAFAGKRRIAVHSIDMTSIRSA